MVSTGDAFRVSLTATAPIPLSMLAESAPVVAQLRFTLSPSTIVAESVVNELITGRVFTVTVTLSVTVPFAFVAVMVYVVVIEGDSSCEPWVFAVTAPMP